METSTVMDHLGDNLAAYLDGALGPEQAGAVRAHLADCPACRAEVDQLRALDRRLAAWGAVEPRFAQTPYSARQALRARVGLVGGGRTARQTAWALVGSLAVVLLVLAASGQMAPGGGRGPGADTPRWTTFVGGLGQHPMFSLDYPSDWNLTEMSFSPPSMTLSLRFSTYKPPVDLAATPGPNDAEIWLALGEGSLAEGWAAREIAGLLREGYRERTYQVAGLSALRLTDRTAHFGLYDAVYVPIGPDFTARIHLSAAADRYVGTFDTMLDRLQVMPPVPTAPALP